MKKDGVKRTKVTVQYELSDIRVDVDFDSDDKTVWVHGSTGRGASFFGSGTARFDWEDVPSLIEVLQRVIQDA